MRSPPLSPHLQVYRLQLTSALSILHRITGMGLVVSLFFLVAGLTSLTLGESAYLSFCRFMSTWAGQLVIFFSLFGFYYHLGNGIRHLVWDTGHGYEISTVYKSGWAVVIFAITSTLLTWFLA